MIETKQITKKNQLKKFILRFLIWFHESNTQITVKRIKIQTNQSKKFRAELAKLETPKKKLVKNDE